MAEATALPRGTTLAATAGGRRIRSPRRQLVDRLLRSPHFVVGLVIIVLLVVMALAAPLISTYDPVRATIERQFRAPSGAHPFGTDEFGRDVFTRVLYGGRISLRVGALATLLAVAAGSVIGLLAGYYRGWVDLVSQRLTEVLMAFPGLLLALAIIAILGTGLENVLLALAIGGIPYYARLVRGQVLSARAMEYVEAARVLGASDLRLLVKHIFPNVVSPLIVVASIDLGYNILSASALSFIGLGAQPPSPEWGAMLATGRDFIREQWWIGTFPGIAIVLAVLGMNLLGDGLRDALDPRAAR